MSDCDWVCYAVISSNNWTRQKKSFRGVVAYVDHLRRLRQALRNIALFQSSVAGVIPGVSPSNARS